MNRAPMHPALSSLFPDGKPVLREVSPHDWIPAPGNLPRW